MQRQGDFQSDKRRRRQWQTNVQRQRLPEHPGVGPDWYGEFFRFLHNCISKFELGYGRGHGHLYGDLGAHRWIQRYGPVGMCGRSN